MKMASTMATFIQVQKASVGEVKTSSIFSPASGREMKRMAGSVMKTAMTRPTPAAPEGEALADGAHHVGLGVSHGLGERPPLSQARRDGRREGAAAAVGVV